jgi:hypothetical protein
MKRKKENEKEEKEENGKKEKKDEKVEEKKIDFSSLKIQTLIAISIFIFSIILFVIFYKSPKPTELTEITKQTETIEFNTSQCKRYITFDFKKSFEYLVISKNATSKIKSNFLGKEEKDGKEYYVIENFVTTNIFGKEFFTYLKIYMDENLTCVFQEVNTTVEGKEYKKKIPCSGEMMKICEDDLEYLGNETIKVRAGTFNAKVYNFKGAKIWISEEMKIPVKTESEDLNMELLWVKR